MSENALIQKIKDDALAVVAEIKAAAQAEVAGVVRETEAALALLKTDHEASLQKKKEHLELVAVSRARQTGNIALQQAKRNQIDGLFAEVMSDLEGSSAEDYVSRFEKHAISIVPKDVVVTDIYAPTNRVSETETILKNLGLTGEVTTQTNLKAGFLVHTTDGVYDVTLERLMNEKRSEIEMEVVRTVLS